MLELLGLPFQLLVDLVIVDAFLAKAGVLLDEIVL